MDYRYIYPLYTKDDYESARDYLADSLYKNITSNAPEGMPPNMEALRAATKDMVVAMYGVNLIRIANFHAVQDIVVNKYVGSIVSYMNLCGIKCRSIEVQYPKIIPQIIAYKAQQPDFKPLVQFNPRVEWDLSYGSDIAKNLMNPLNSMSHYFLELSAIYQYKFVREIAPIYYGNAFDDQIDTWEKENKLLWLTLKILPSDNLHNINILIKRYLKEINFFLPKLRQKSDVSI